MLFSVQLLIVIYASIQCASIYTILVIVYQFDNYLNFHAHTHSLYCLPYYFELNEGTTQKHLRTHSQDKWSTNINLVK